VGGQGRATGVQQGDEDGNRAPAECDTVVKAVHVKPGDIVVTKDLLVEVGRVPGRRVLKQTGRRT